MRVADSVVSVSVNRKKELCSNALCLQTRWMAHSFHLHRTSVFSFLWPVNQDFSTSVNAILHSFMLSIFIYYLGRPL